MRAWTIEPRDATFSVLPPVSPAGTLPPSGLPAMPVRPFDGARRALLVLVAALVSACAAAVPDVPQPLTERAYVWQRVWTPAVHEAVAGHDLDDLGVLTHEVSWVGHEPRIVGVRTPDLDASVVRAVRVAVPPEGVDLPTALAPVLDALCPVATVHLDLDLPTRRLPEYAAWLDRLRPRCDVRITALPTWLDSPDFAAVARTGFVLQVHWFDPRDPSGPLLKDDALQAIHRAGALGVPFEVALPAYGHRVWLRDGRVVRLDSEVHAKPPPGASPLHVLADPERVATLLASLRADPPPTLRGIWWFRLPTRQDDLGWSAATLSAVRHGDALVHDLQLQSGPVGDRTDLCLHNAGNVFAWPAPIPVERGHVGGGRQGWTFSLARGSLLPPPLSPPLQPGETRCVGWTRSMLVTHAP